ncbi:MAG TPA: hypothetical protein DCF91_06920 [Porphyromonadaceae bacterium]|nr:hypothetical protein [Porphyromonadaceae bacterium]
MFFKWYNIKIKLYYLNSLIRLFVNGNILVLSVCIYYQIYDANIFIIYQYTIKITLNNAV